MDMLQGLVCSRGLGSSQEAAGPGERKSWTQRTGLWTAAQHPCRSDRICHSTEDAVQGSQPMAETGGQLSGLRHPPHHNAIPIHLPLPSPTQPNQSPASGGWILGETGCKSEETEKPREEGICEEDGSGHRKSKKPAHLGHGKGTSGTPTS